MTCQNWEPIAIEMRIDKQRLDVEDYADSLTQLG